MGIARHGPLVGAFIYVVAVSALLSGSGAEIPLSISSSLELRQYVFLSRTIPSPEDALSGKGPGLPSGLIDGLEEQARKPYAKAQDRLDGAALAIYWGSPYLVPLFTGPIAGTNPTASVLLDWSLDPTFTPTSRDMALIEASGIDDHLADVVSAVFARAAGDEHLFTQAKARAIDKWNETMLLGVALGLGALVVLAIGSALWLRVIRGFPRPGTKASGLTPDVVLPITRVFVYFLAVFLTAGIMIPRAVALAGIEVPAPWLSVVSYVLVGTAGLYLVSAVGRFSPGQRWTYLVGLKGPWGGSRAETGRALRWGAGSYCMLWPAVIVASVFSSALFGEGGGTFDNPMAVYLATEPDGSSIVLVLLSVSILAPLFEEPLFRGYLYRGLRSRLAPVPAAALSGALFGAAHMSAAGFLPLAAIGFTLALAYERSGSLATPILAHGAWNLVEAAILLLVFR